MPKANFVVGWVNGQPDLPPMEAESGIQLSYDLDGERKGGFCVISPRVDGTVIVQVDTSASTLAAMEADPSKYIWLEDMLNEHVA